MDRVFLGALTTVMGKTIARNGATTLVCGAVELEAITRTRAIANLAVGVEPARPRCTTIVMRSWRERGVAVRQR